MSEVPTADWSWINATADRFERAWKQGLRPRIEDYLAEVEESQWPSLLAELMRVESELRRQAGEEPTVAEYRRRFSDSAALVEAVLGPELRLEGPCDRFEAALRAGRRARIEDFLNDGTETGPSTLLGELILVEVEYRLRRGEAPRPEEYRQRFPAHDLDWLIIPETPGAPLGLEPGRTDPVICSNSSAPTSTDSPRGPSEPVSLAEIQADFDPSSDLDAAGYEVVGELGSGGMGIVSKAWQRGLNRLVAIKMIRGGKNARSDYVARFRFEAEAVARLRHPNILQIYGIGEVRGLPFVALELLEGGSLGERLGGTPQPGPQAAGLLVTLARAVHAAHRAGIIHRDLKPSNVLFSAEGMPKITDFGLAKRLESDSQQTESGQIMGSPSYMAPEQARGHAKAVGPAADVYALGAILYEMLVGRPPFKGETPMETVRQVIDIDPVPPSRLVPNIARDLETICLKCLAKEPHRRYATAAALADDLQRYLDGEPIAGRRTPAWERGVKWTRRHPVAATLMTLVTTAFLGLLGGGVVQNRLEEQRINAARTNYTRLVLQAQQRQALGDFARAKSMLLELRPRIESERKLHDLHVLAEDLLASIDRREAEERARAADHARHQEFLARRRQALVHETQFTGLDRLSNQEETRRWAQAALAVFADSGAGDTWALGPLPTSLSPREQAEVVEGCYELLLILAEAEPMADQGLRRLDQAARLRPPTRAYHLRRSACLARAGDGAGVQRELRAAERLPATTASDHFLIGQERYKRRDWITATQDFEAALQREPDHFWAHCLSAICRINLKLYAQAKADLVACLQREPGSAWLYVLRGFASSHIGALARDAVEKLPTAGTAFRTEVKLQFEAAESDYGRALELLEQAPNDELRYALLVNRGLLWYERRDWDKAVADLQAAIRLNGRQYQAYAELAAVYQRQGKPDEAEAQFGRAIDLRPDWSPLYRGRAQVNLGRKDSTPAQRERALRDLDAAIRHEPPGSPVLALDHTNRGRLLHREGRQEEALTAAQAALEVVADYADAHRLRIEVLQALHRYDEVIRSCDALLARGKPSAELYELRGLVRERLKDYAGAIEDETQAIALGRDGVSLRARRGWLYLVSNAPQLALRDFEEAIRLDATAGDAYLGRGSARVRLGLHREAVADAERALRRTEPAARTLYNAARIYAQAATAATADVRRYGQGTVVMVNRYQDRAVALVREARRRLPAAERSAFEREVIQADPALNSLRRRLRSIELSGPRTSAAR